ncbi:MAG: PatB family C-S lyase [Candidatus Cloacimonadales bacterium]
MKYDFDTIIDRKNSGCFKYDAMKMVYGRDDLLALWVADMEFAIAPEILSKIKERIEHPIFGYNYKDDTQYSNFINYVEEHHDWKLDPSWLQMSPGIVPAINFMVKIFTNPGQRILIQQPVYTPFKDAVTANDRTLVVNNLIETDGYYTIDFDDLDKKLENCKIFIFCSPHNPVGRVWTKEELLKVGALCQKHKVILITDEIHNDLIFSESTHTPIAKLNDFAEFTITLMAPSKTFNIAGLQSAIIICSNPKLLDPIKKFLTDVHIFGSNAIGAVAFDAAYERGGEWLKELLTYLEANRDYVFERISKMKGVKMLKPEGTFLAWLDFRENNISNRGLQNFCIHEAKLALNAGISFGKPGSGFMRLNFGCPRSILVQAMDNLERALKRI